ncbi:MAG: TetR/AcrR family transcriptional regulator [Hahellaceae bacterium]|nr:TetR/AcrR family transcriptional regulator [Hahellaceae bacterium]
MAKNPKTAQKIVDAAVRMFCEAGYSQASMDLIAKSADVSKATLYSHFANKAALFAAAVLNVSERFVVEIDPERLSQMPLEDALRYIGRYYLSFLLKPENLAAVRAVIAETIRQPEAGREFYEAGPLISLNAVARFLKQRMAQGELPHRDTITGARHFVALLRGDFHWRLLLGVPVDLADMDRHITEAVRQFLQGYALTDTACD